MKQAEPVEERYKEPDGWQQRMISNLYRSVEEDSWSEEELESAGMSRQRLDELREQDRLFAIELPYRRCLVYPSWQFDKHLSLKEYLPQVLAVARELGLDGLTVHRILTNPAAGGGVRPLELCKEGRIDIALGVLRTFGESGG